MKTILNKRNKKGDQMGSKMSTNKWKNKSVYIYTDANMDLKGRCNIRSIFREQTIIP